MQRRSTKYNNIFPCVNWNESMIYSDLHFCQIQKDDFVSKNTFLHHLGSNIEKYQKYYGIQQVSNSAGMS